MVAITETWTGTNGAAWPAQWVEGKTGTGATASIQSNAGQFQSVGASNYDAAAAISRRLTTQLGDFDAVFEFWRGETAEAYPKFDFRTTDTFIEGGDGYRVDLGNGTLASRSNYGNVTTWNSGYSISATAHTFCRVRASGSSIKVKFWGTSLASEPTTGGADGNGFQIAATDAGLTSGYFGFRLEVGSASATRTFNVDNLTIGDPPAVTPPASTRGFFGVLMSIGASLAVAGAVDVVVTPPSGGGGTSSADQGRLFGGFWLTGTSGRGVEDRAAYNGTGEAGRGNVPYSTRVANQARYSKASTPVQGNWEYGYSTIFDHKSAPLYVVTDPNHPKVKVTWMTNNGSGPPATDSQTAGLQAACNAVPMPVGPAGQLFKDYYGRDPWGEAGGDKSTIVIDKSSPVWKYWEFWLTSYNATLGRYECGYAGYSENIQGAGAMEAFPNTWGSRATGLPLATSNLMIRDWERGIVDHPLSLGVPVSLRPFIPPANRDDGFTVANTANGDSRDAVPEGSWYRLPPSYVVDTAKYGAGTARSKLFAMMTACARDYGFIVADQTGGTVTFGIEGTNAVGTPYSPYATTTRPPDDPASGYYGTSNVLNDFPWTQLVQVKY